ncbi:MAG: AraC family transcriptional regulator [Aeromonadaceae bacterium]|nr:AraC family transcriptional regulator [Aeromonadaceae bacterium]
MRHPEEYRRRLTRALHHLLRHLAQTPSLSEVAAVACFSPYHFHRLFAAVMGETLAEYGRRLRLEWALFRLLDPSRPSVAQVAGELGYASPQNFAKSFKQFFGHTPSQIRACGALTRVRQLLTAQAPGPWLTSLEQLGPLAAPSPQPSGDHPMDVTLVQRPSQLLAYIRVVGPYAQTMPAGFERLGRWSQERGLCDGDWLALYWDNPEQTPEEQLRADVALSVPDGTQVGGEVQLQSLPAGTYACYRCRVTDGDFASPWQALFSQWLPDSGYQPAEGPCFEQYLNDGRESGIWELNIFTPVKPLTAEAL